MSFTPLNPPSLLLAYLVPEAERGDDGDHDEDDDEDDGDDDSDDSDGHTILLL